jgi:hypothetical protein
VTDNPLLKFAKKTTAARMSTQAKITSVIQTMLDNGASVQTTFGVNGDVKVAAQPQTRRCSNKNGRGVQCKRRVPLDSKWKRCDHCRGIAKKRVQKCTAAFRAGTIALSIAPHERAKVFLLGQSEREVTKHRAAAIRAACMHCSG